MKKIITSLFLTVAIFSYGQNEIKVVEKKMTMGKVSLNVIEVKIGDDQENIKKSFTRYCKDNLDIKLKGKGKNRLIAEKVIAPSFTEKTGDLMAMITQEGQNSKLAVGYFMGYDISINNEDYPEETKRLKEFVRRYAIYHESLYYKEILVENQKRLDNLNADLKKKEKEIKSLTKRTQKNNKAISKENDSNKKFDLSNQNIANRSRIELLNNMVVTLRAEIDNVNSVIESAKDSLRKLESQSYQSE